MKYIIMADGKGTRWANAEGIPKHLVKVGNETLLERSVRLIKEYDSKADIIITSHDKRYEIKDSTRYEPKNNVLEIDRFTEELIEDNVCFMYGDTYYSNDAMNTIVNTDIKNSPLIFFGTEKSIVAIKVKDGNIFKSHVDNVRTLYKKGLIKKCIGWQVYASYTNASYDDKVISKDFIKLKDNTTDFNKYEEYLDIKKDLY